MAGKPKDLNYQTPEVISLDEVERCSELFVGDVSTEVLFVTA